MQGIDQVQPGWKAIDNQGDKIGQIEEVGPNYLLLTKGLIFVKDVYVPFDAVNGADPDAQEVQLNVAKGEIDNQGWDDIPGGSNGASGGSDVRSESASGFGGGSTSGQTVESGDTMRVPVHEEQLRAETRREQAGEVAVGKNVVEERREMDVPVSRDEVQVTRHAVDRPSEGDETAFGDGGTIRVPVTAEQVQVTKEPRVVEEIEISKRPVTQTQRVSDTVKREEVNVDDSGNVLTGAGASRSVGSGSEWQDNATQTGATRDSGTSALDAEEDR
ncbi:MAG TPA: YsnF/AvaK domain-containing protein [Candidatus Limnocylindrales bacterium]|jgi:uncharacterized protein (TIGR02271 family)